MFTIDAWTITEMRRLPRPLVAIFDEITDFGKSGWLLFPLAFALFCFAALPATLPQSTQMIITTLTARLGFIFVAITLPGLFTLFSKYLIGRARPYAADGNPHVFHLLFRPEYASLPSGHSTTAFAAATAISAVWPKAGIPAWLYALTIGASRIIVTAHFPSDVMASAIVGVTGAILVRNYFASRGYVFSITQGGDIYPFAGPSWRRFKSATDVKSFMPARSRTSI